MLIHVRISEGVQSEFFFHQTDGPFKWGGGGGSRGSYVTRILRYIR